MKTTINTRITSFFLREMSADTIQSERLDTFLKRFLIIDLSINVLSIYFMPPYDKNLFLLTSIISLIVLLVWCQIRYKVLNPLPKSLTIGSLVFILFVAVSAVLSQDQKLAMIYLVQLRFLVLSRLLYNAPIPDQSRKHVIIILFLSAAVAGLVGIMQSFGLMSIVGDRSYGFSEHPITYALILAVACSSAIIMVFIPKTSVFTSKKGLYFLVIVIFLTFYGVIVSQTRGAWIAILIAPLITILLHDRKKAILYFLCFIAMFTVVSLSNIMIKNSDEFIQRGISILTSCYKEKDITGSTRNRLELWKGAILIFKEYPIAGCGLGDFELNIKKLILQSKLQPGTSAALHAHNIYLQALATCGLLGLVLMAALMISLITWGIKRIRGSAGIGGYVIILNTILFMVVGLTYSPHGDTMFMAVCCLTIGLMGPYEIKNSASIPESGTKPVIS